MEFKYKPKVKHIEMPCWIGWGLQGPICVFHFGQASVMWEARCKSSPLPTHSCCALCSWSTPSPAKTAVYLGDWGGLWFGLVFFFLALYPLCLVLGETQRLQLAPPWYPVTPQVSLTWGWQSVCCLGEEQEPNQSVLTPSKITVQLL